MSTLYDAIRNVQKPKKKSRHEGVDITDDQCLALSELRKTHPRLLDFVLFEAPYKVNVVNLNRSMKYGLSGRMHTEDSMIELLKRQFNNQAQSLYPGDYPIL